MRSVDSFVPGDQNEKLAIIDDLGAILVIALLIVPAAAARLLTRRLALMLAIAFGIGWMTSVAGYVSAVAIDASIAGMMGVTALIAFAVAMAVAAGRRVLTHARGAPETAPRDPAR